MEMPGLDPSMGWRGVLPRVNPLDLPYSARYPLRMARASIPLFRWGGVAVRMHATLPVAPLLAAATGIASGTEYLRGIGVLMSLLLHAAVVEWAAQRRNGPPEEIVLTPFGSLRGREDAAPLPPGDAMSPLIVSFLAHLAAAFLCHHTAGLLEDTSDWKTGGAWNYLAQFNVLLGLLNLLPATPLTGAQRLQAVLNMQGGHLLRAGICRRAGRTSAFLLAVWGLWPPIHTIALFWALLIAHAATIPARTGPLPFMPSAGDPNHLSQDEIVIGPPPYAHMEKTGAPEARFRASDLLQQLRAGLDRLWS